MNKTYLLGALAIPFAVAATPEIVAKVDGAEILSTHVTERAEALRKANLPAAPSDTLNSLVDDELLVAEGAELKLDRDPAVVRQLERRRRELAAERFVDAELNGAKFATDEVLRAMYHSTSDSISFDALVLLSREEAQAALDRLKAGGKLADEARRSLEPRAKVNQGSYGPLSPVGVPAGLAAAVEKAPIGELTGPIQLELGWLVLRVKERTAADEAGFQAGKAKIRAFAIPSLQAQAKKHLFSQLRKAVKLDEKFLDGLGVRVAPENEAEASHVLATVGGEVVRYGDVVPAVLRIAGDARNAHTSGASVKREIAWRLVDELLLEQEALRRGFGKDPSLEPRLAIERRFAMGAAAASRIQQAAPSPTGAEVEAFYRQRQSEYLIPAHRACAHIVAAARPEAEAIKKRIAGGESFEALAKRLSVDKLSGEKGGALGEVSFDRLDELARGGAEPALADAFRSVKAKEIGGPIQSRIGWHIVRCGPVAAAAPRPLDEVRGEILGRMQADRRSAALKSHLAKLRARAKVSVDEAALARALSSSSQH